MISEAPPRPQTYGVQAIEATKGWRSTEAKFLFQMFEPSVHTQTACGQAQVEVGHRESKAGKFGAQVRHIEYRTEEGDQQCAPVEFCLQPVGCQRVALDQRGRGSVPMQPDHGDGSSRIVGGETGCLNIEIERSGSARVIESPMLAAGKPCRERGEILGLKCGKGLGKVIVI